MAAAKSPVGAKQKLSLKQSDNNEKETTSAIRIQAFFRGYAARKRVSDMVAGLITELQNSLASLDLSVSELLPRTEKATDTGDSTASSAGESKDQPDAAQTTETAEERSDAIKTAETAEAEGSSQTPSDAASSEKPKSSSKPTWSGLASSTLKASANMNPKRTINKSGTNKRPSWVKDIPDDEELGDNPSKQEQKNIPPWAKKPPKAEADSSSTNKRPSWVKNSSDNDESGKSPINLGNKNIPPWAKKSPKAEADSSSTNKRPSWVKNSSDNDKSGKSPINLGNKIPPWAKKSPKVEVASGETDRFGTKLPPWVKKSSSGAETSTKNANDGQPGPSNKFEVEHAEDEYADLKGLEDDPKPPKQVSTLGELKFPSLQSEESDGEIDDELIGEALKEMYAADADDTTTGDISTDEMTTSDIELDEEFMDGIRQYMEEASATDDDDYMRHGQGSDHLLRAGNKSDSSGTFGGDLESINAAVASHASSSSGFQQSKPQKRESVALAARISMFSSPTPKNASIKPVEQARRKSAASGIANRIKAFNSKKEEQDDKMKMKSSADVLGSGLSAGASRALDFTARQYLLHMSATKIQALTRGFIYRKKDFTKTRNVVEKLSQKQRVSTVSEDIEESTETTNDEAVEEVIETNDLSMAVDEGPMLSVVERRKQLEFAKEQSALAAAEITRRVVAATDDGEKKPSAFAVRQNLMHKSATKIQAMVRGRAVRKVDLAGMMYAVAWLKKRRVVLEQELTVAHVVEEDLSDSDDDFDDPEVSAFMARQISLQKAAIRIQSIARGYLCRKVDYQAMMNAIEFVKLFQAAYAPQKVERVPEPKIKHLEKVCAILEQSNVINLSGTNDDGVETPKVDVKNLLSTWEWLKKNASSSEAVSSKKDDNDNSVEKVDSKTRDPKKASSKPKLKQLSALYRYMDAYNLHSPKTSHGSNRVDTGLIQSRTQLLKEGGNQFRPESEKKIIYLQDDSIEAGGDSAVSGSEPKTRIYHDSSVVAGGESGDQKPKVRYLYDNSISAGGSGEEHPKTRVYYDTSVQVGGESIDQKPKVRYLYDNSITAGGTGEEHGDESETFTIPPPKVAEIVALWKWLESNNMDMSFFKKWENGNPSDIEPEPRKWGSLKNQGGEVYVESGSLEEHDTTDEFEKEVGKPTIFSMLNYWKFSRMYSGSRQKQETEDEGGPMGLTSDEDAGGDGHVKSSVTGGKGTPASSAQSGKGETPPWMKIKRPDKKNDDDTEGSGPIEWVIDDDGNRVERKSDARNQSKTASSGKSDTPPWMKLSRPDKKNDDDSDGSGPIEWVIDDEGNRVERESEAASSGKSGTPPWMKINRPDKKNDDDDSEGSGPIEWVIDDDGNKVESKHHDKNQVRDSKDKSETVSSGKSDIPPWMKINRPDKKNDDDSEGSGPIEWVIDAEGNQTAKQSGTAKSRTETGKPKKAGWIFSPRSLDNDDSSEESGPIEWILDEDDDGNPTEEKRAEGKGQRSKTKSWILSPSKNRMMSTLKWMENQGMDFDNVTIDPPADQPVSDRSSTDQAVHQEGSDSPSTNDMISTLAWLNKRGLYKKNGSFCKKKSDDERGEIESESFDTNRTDTYAGEKEPMLDVDVDELPKDHGTPAVSDMADALNWLKSHGFGSKDAGERASSMHDKGGQSEDAIEPSTSTLYSLSWLQKHGLDLGRQQAPSSTAKTNTDAESKELFPVEEGQDENTPSIQDMLSAVVWLDKKGFGEKKDAKFPSNRDGSDQEDDEDDSPPEFLKVALSWLEVKGVPPAREAMSRYKREDRMTSKDMTNALGWLEKSGFKLDKAKAVQESDRYPSADAFAKAMESLDGEPGKVVGVSKKPSTQDMQTALNFLESQEKKDNEPKIPSWKQKLLSAKKIILGDNRPDWLERRIAAINKADGKAAIGNSPYANDEAVEAPITRGGMGIESKGTPEAKLKAAKTKVTKSDKGNKTVLPGPSGRFSTPPSAADMKNAMDFLEKTEPEALPKKAGTKGQILKDGKLYTKKILPSRGQQSKSWFQAPGEDEIASKLQEKKESKSKTSKKKDDAASKSRKSGKKDKQLAPSSPKQPAPSSPKNKEASKNMTKKDLEIEDALRWLKTGVADSGDDIAYYKKLNAVLPKRESQSMEDRAKEMVKAMKWVKKQEGGSKSGQIDDTNSDQKAGNHEQPIEESDDLIDPASPLQKRETLDLVQSLRKEKKVPSKASKMDPKDELLSPKKGKRGKKKKDSQLSPKTPKKKSKKAREPAGNPASRNRDFDNALAWLGSKSDDLEDARYFKKLDTMMPKKSGQSMEDRAKEMVKALKFVRKTKGKKSEDGKSDAVVKHMDDVDETSADKSEDKRVEDDSEIGRDVTSKDASGSEGLREESTGATRSPEPLPAALMNNNDAADVFRWLNNEAVENSEDVTQFKKVNAMIPKKPGQSNEDRALELAKALKFLRKKGIGVEKRTDVDEQEVKSAGSDGTTGKKDPSSSEAKPAVKDIHEKTEMPPSSATAIPKASVNQGKTAAVKPKVIPAEVLADKDTGDVLKWLNSDMADSGEEAIQFKKVSAMIPKKPGQSNEERAVELAKALKFLRKKGIGVEKKVEKKVEKEEAPKPSPAEDTAVAKNDKDDKWDKVRNIVKDMPKSPAKKPPTAAETARLHSILLDKDTRNAYRFLKNEALDSGEKVSNYEKVSASLPIKTGQSNEDRAIEMAKALKLLRKKEMAEGKGSSNDGAKGSGGKPTPEKDLENALAWLENKAAGKDVDGIEDTGYFKKLDKMVAKKANQTTEDRAKEMVKLLSWLRKKGLAKN